MSKLENRIRLINRLRELGFSYEEANQLRRIEMTLHRWAEFECGDERGNCIERDEETGLPYLTYEAYEFGACWGVNGKRARHPIADREKGALKRLDAILARHPGLVRYQQGDPCGCALYILRRTDIGTDSIDSIYTRGVAVCD